ncbi:MAG: carbamoyltransferase HypF [Kiritimatiellae bacterium]|nr:carbamoyltransferase HypF [Kiritimatiellia bacterium]
MSDRWTRETIEVSGLVQGVGFRPAIARRARAVGLRGSICNRRGTVRLILEGPSERVAAFVKALRDHAPPRARIERIELVARETIPAAAASPDFRVVDSDLRELARPQVPPDLAMCAACRAEVLDPADRRHGYPFTTCCDCGPRYTVIGDMPYDRERTTMSVFQLCEECRREYEDPASRRYHAESIACPRCGPRLWATDPAGRVLEGDPIRLARATLAGGGIVALRGLGGFLLAVDALNRGAILRLRERKRRPYKPFAVMAASLAAAEKFCVVSGVAAELLGSAEAPIVILEPRGEGALPVEAISPDVRTVGVMLPATPLQLLLAVPIGGDPVPVFELLVMTSGNRSGAPICLDNAGALRELGAVADVFLLHDREIRFRADDSLVALRDGRPQLWRRARGYAPRPLPLARPLRRAVLAMGAELKNAIAVGAGAEVYLSPHIGDLEDPDAVDQLRRVAEHLPRFLRIDPAVIAVDLHPDYHATRLGRELAARLGCGVVEVQHHHAHAAAAMAEHGVEALLALTWDGTGLGTDGRIWGAELLWLPEDGRMERLATFEPAPLPGGDAAVLEPRRQIVARWAALGLALTAQWRQALGLAEAQLEVWSRLRAGGPLAPLTHAAGRLFDAVAAALGVAPERVSYEGQTAIRLEGLAARAATVKAPGAWWRASEQEGMLRVNWSPLLLELFDRGPVEPDTAAVLARALHVSLADAALAMARHGRERTGHSTVALTGGVFMNRILHEETRGRLEADGFQVLVHRAVPPNDGGIAAGQAWVAGRRPEV